MKINFVSMTVAEQKLVNSLVNETDFFASPACDCSDYSDVERSWVRGHSWSYYQNLPWHSTLTPSLRRSGWRVYYWRSRDQSPFIDDDYNSAVNYGRQSGLIFGRYCARLMHWRMVNE